MHPGRLGLDLSGVLINSSSARSSLNSKPRTRTRTRMLSLSKSLVLGLFCLSAPLSVGAQETSAPPTPEQILTHRIKALGGQAALSKLTNRVSTGTILYTSFDIPATYSLIETRGPNKLLKTQSEGMGTYLEGCTKDAAWIWSLMSGPQIQKGQFLAQALQQAPLDAPLHWKDRFENIEYQGLQEVDGIPCHTLKLKPKSAPIETHYYDAKSGHLLRLETTKSPYATPMPVTITYSDFQTTDGISLPRAINEKHADSEELIIKILKIEHDTHLPETAFEPPLEIQDLLTQEK